MTTKPTLPSATAATGPAATIAGGELYFTDSQGRQYTKVRITARASAASGKFYPSPEPYYSLAAYGERSFFGQPFRDVNVAELGVTRQWLEHHLIVFFRANHDRLKSVYKRESFPSSLHYDLVLLEDTNENRDVILDILDEPIIEPYLEQCPVYFQFYPSDLENSIRSAESIRL